MQEPCKKKDDSLSGRIKDKEEGTEISRVGQAADRMLDVRNAQLSHERLFSLCRCVYQSHLNVKYDRLMKFLIIFKRVEILYAIKCRNNLQEH